MKGWALLNVKRDPAHLQGNQTEPSMSWAREKMDKIRTNSNPDLTMALFALLCPQADTSAKPN